jgi:hypothetical protein
MARARRMFKKNTKFRGLGQKLKIQMDRSREPLARGVRGLPSSLGAIAS